MTRRPEIPAGSWPRQLNAALAAGYCGEPSVEAFLSRVGTEYPEPTVSRGRTGLWLKDAIDEALERRHQARRTWATTERNEPIPSAAEAILAARAARGAG
jgi:hypothetical protein